MSSVTRRDVLKVGLATAAALATGEALAGTTTDAGNEFAFHRDHALGTSLDLHVLAPSEAVASEAELVVLAEIERLRQIFSTYDPASEISRINATHAPVAVSPEMAEVLHANESWARKCGGAFSGHAGVLSRVWKEAEKIGSEPSPAVLDRIARDLHQPAWSLDSATGTVTRVTEQELNFNAIAKVYIIDMAVEAVRATLPGVRGMLVNLGGDVFAWGEWGVGIQDPFRHFDNAAPLAGLKLANQAVATSGGYERFFTIGGNRYSHIIDPRTGRPAEGVASATVVAADNVTANALSTALCVLTPEEGLKLVASVPGAECLVIAADGKRFASAGLKLFEVVATQDKKDAPKDAPKGEAWPAGFQVTVAIELPKIDAKRYRKPYSAIWIEDDKGTPVRTLAVWGNAPKYLKDLSDWWKFAKGDQALIKAVTKATRGPGKYELAWDGKDDKGNALPQGTYTVRVEVHREFGAHLRQSGKIECLDKTATVKMDKNEETAETVVEFKKPEKK